MNENKKESGHGRGHRRRCGGEREYQDPLVKQADGTCRADDYEAMDKDSRLIMNMRDAGHMIRFLFEGKGSQKRILIILLERGQMTQRELTEKLGIQPGSASEVIGKLENAGLIIRTPSEADRRTANVKLTDEGMERAREAALQRKKRHQEMFSCLTEEEKDALLSLTEKINRHWDERYRDAVGETDGNGTKKRGCRQNGRHGRS